MAQAARKIQILTVHQMELSGRFLLRRCKASVDPNSMKGYIDAFSMACAPHGGGGNSVRKHETETIGSIRRHSYMPSAWSWCNPWSAVISSRHRSSPVTPNDSNRDNKASRGCGGKGSEAVEKCVLVNTTSAIMHHACVHSIYHLSWPKQASVDQDNSIWNGKSWHIFSGNISGGRECPKLQIWVVPIDFEREAIYSFDGVRENGKLDVNKSVRGD